MCGHENSPMGGRWVEPFEVLKGRGFCHGAHLLLHLEALISGVM